MKKSSVIYTQDATHILTKMKTRLLKYGLDLIIGEHKISSEHLMYLINNVDKNEHLLTISDLNFRDKMKFKPVQKIINPLVSAALSLSIASQALEPSCTFH